MVNKTSKIHTLELAFFKKFPDFSSPGFNEKEYYNIYMNSSVLINARSRHAKFPENPGGPLTIKHVFKGEEYYLSGNRLYRVNKKNFLLFNQSQKYSSYINTDEETHSFSVFFESSFVNSVLSSLLMPQDKILESPDNTKSYPGQLNFIETLYPADNFIIPLLAEIRQSMIHKDHSAEYYGERLYCLLAEVLKLNRQLYGSIQKVQAVKLSTKLEVYKRLCIARDYIESSIEQKVTLGQIAKASCMCEHHLLREFRKYYNLTPYQYLIRARLNNARELLSASEMPVSEISIESGFEYLSSFSQSFIRHFKMTPTDYRRSQKVNFK